MTETELTFLRNRLVGELPLCPANYASACVRQAATQFFRDSEVWRYDSEDIDIAKDQAIYEIVLEESSGVDIWRIDYAKYSGAVISEKEYTLEYFEVDEVYAYYFQFKEDYIPEEDVNDGLDITVVLASSVISGYVDPAQWHRWSEAILSCARVIAFTSPLRPWYSSIGQMTAMTEYNDWLARARIERTQQFSADGDLRVSNPEGWL